MGTMAILNSKPTHPVIHHAPTFRLVVRNFRFSDWVTLCGVTAVSIPLGMMATKHRFLRAPMAWAMATVGFLGAFSFGYQNSAFRLMGLRENETECKRYPRRLDYAG